MISFLGYNFCSDGNSIDPIPTDVSNVINTQIQAGTFSHLHVSKNIDKEPTFNIPLEWDVDTIMDCNFDDNISAGSVTRIISDLDKIIVRRTPVGTYDWITIKVLDIKNDPSSLGGAFVDALTANGVEYEYQFIPVLGDLEERQLQRQFFPISKVYFCVILTLLFACITEYLLAKRPQINR